MLKKMALFTTAAVSPMQWNSREENLWFPVRLMIIVDIKSSIIVNGLNILSALEYPWYLV
jgi:hypothetical protein